MSAVADGGLELRLVGARDAVAAGTMTSRTLTEAALARADQFDESHHLFITRLDDAALESADAADAAVAQGAPLGPLHGVPITVKDNVDVGGVRGTAGSRVLADRVPVEDATVVTRLKAAGAIVLGKLNMHEMATGATSMNPHYGWVGNPWVPGRVAGGSSGASAAAVALRVGFASLGTDAGGSVRIPAMCCGGVGLKQTHGLVSLFGGMPTTAQHVDHIGPHTLNVADARLMLDVMAGYDPRDAHSSPRVAPRAVARENLCGLRVGVPAYFWADLDREVDTASSAVLDAMADAGAVIEPVDLDLAQLAAGLRVLLVAESYVFHEPYLRAHPEHYSDDLRDRILAGGQVLAQDYIRAMRARRLMMEAVRTVFAAFDVLAMPTLPIPAPLQSEAAADASLMSTMTRNTSPFNQTGHPAITVPVGTTALGAPIGFQLVADAFADYELLAIAEVVEALVAFDPTPPVLRTASVG
ncbi:MAG: amidase [Desertimonas sp.]